MRGHECVPVGDDNADARPASARGREPERTTASAPRMIALQRSAGNAAVGRLLRQVGWPGTRVLGGLRADTGVSVTPARLVVGGWSAGGNRTAEMAVAEAKSGQPTLDFVVLFEGVNNFQTEVEVDDSRHPGKRIKVRQDPLAGRDKLDIFLQLVARNLKARPRAAGRTERRCHQSLSGQFVSLPGLLRQRRPGDAIAALPAAVRDELRRHYQVIRVAQVGDEAKHRGAIAAGKLDSLGHENRVGSGALLDALRRTRPMRPVLTPPAVP